MTTLRKRQFRKLLAELKIEVPRGGGFHAFRRLNATLLDRLQAPVKIRQERLGHSDPRVTLGTYTHIASEDERRIAENLSGILDPVLDLNRGRRKKSGSQLATLTPATSTRELVAGGCNAPKPPV